jgi:hypothetical protein
VPVILLVFFCAFLWLEIRGYLYPEHDPAVELKLPIRDGCYKERIYAEDTSYVGGVFTVSGYMRVGHDNLAESPTLMPKRRRVLSGKTAACRWNINDFSAC